MKLLLALCLSAAVALAPRHVDVKAPQQNIARRSLGSAFAGAIASVATAAGAYEGVSSMEVIKASDAVLDKEALNSGPVKKAVEDFKGGKVEYRTDRYGNVHVPLGKASFEPSALEQNFRAVIDEIQMIANGQRGAAWTRALLGVRAAEVRRARRRGPRTRARHVRGRGGGMRSRHRCDVQPFLKNC